MFFIRIKTIHVSTYQHKFLYSTERMEGAMLCFFLRKENTFICNTSFLCTQQSKHCKTHVSKKQFLSPLQTTVNM
jgi:hypothetical protein